MNRGFRDLAKRTWLAAACAAAPAVAAGAPADAAGPLHFDSIVEVNGAAAGAYVEETQARDGRIVDTVKQTFVLNRLGSRVTLAESDTFEQDREGRLLGGHFETSSFKDTFTTDVVVKGHVLELRTRAGEHELPA